MFYEIENSVDELASYSYYIPIQIELETHIN